MLVMHRNKFGQEYDILIGGGVEIGEEPEQTVLREVQEESGVRVSQPRLVFIERAPEPYGTQYIFLCNYIDGEPRIDAASIEDKINRMGKNLYQPVWRKTREISTLQLRSPQVKQAMIYALENGFPDSPIDITNFQPV